MKGNLKEKVERAAKKPNQEVEGQHEQTGGGIQKKIGGGKEILGAESAWVRFCDIMGDSIPPSLRDPKVNRVKRR